LYLIGQLVSLFSDTAGLVFVVCGLGDDIGRRSHTQSTRYSQDSSKRRTIRKLIN